MKLSAQEKIDALRELTRGADDVFAVRSDDVWRPCYSPLRDFNLRMHLTGRMEVGSYPLLPTDDWPMCHWVAADFDGKKPGVMWKPEVQRAVQMLLDFDGCPCFVNLSRSGQGAHIRMLFREPVPAWMARRWFMAWLEEGGVIIDADEWDLTAFDRLIPPQDRLSGQLNRHGYRLPGNLIGSPLHRRLARHNGGTLPLSPHQVARGNFEPDGKHWEHVMTALEQRAWGAAELREALKQTPEAVSLQPPAYGIARHLPVLPADDRKLGFMLTFCEFIRYLRIPGNCTYPLWLSLASQLHRFGDAGHAAFHQLSQIDAGRYDPRDTDKKWEQTAMMRPVRCDTLVEMGYRCPHLYQPRCNGTYAPAYFADHTDAEIL